MHNSVHVTKVTKNFIPCKVHPENATFKCSGISTPKNRQITMQL